jgi:hypothetical protein
MEYFELDYVKGNMKYKKTVDEVLEEINKVIDKITFVRVERKRGGHSEIWMDEKTSECLACVDIPDILNLDDLYMFFHEAGHLVNKHLSDLKIRLTIREEEVISREREADTYALSKMEKLLHTLGLEHRDRKKLENIIAVIKLRIDSGYESYKAKKKVGFKELEKILSSPR